MSATPARVAVASRSIIAPRASRAPRGHARVRRARPVVVRRAGLEDTSDASVRSPAEEGEPTVTGPFPVDLSTLTADERAWLDARDELRVLVLGKTGVGKSSLVNAIANANSAIGRLDVGTTQVQRVENRITHGDESHDVCLFDTPGFFDVEGRTPAGVLRELGGKVDDYHAIVYAHVATDRRLRLEDEQSVSFIVSALGARCVSRVVIALTFANPHCALNAQAIQCGAHGVYSRLIGSFFISPPHPARRRKSRGFCHPYSFERKISIHLSQLFIHFCRP